MWVLLWDIQWVVSWLALKHLELVMQKVILSQNQFHLAKQNRWCHEDDLAQKEQWRDEAYKRSVIYLRYQNNISNGRLDEMHHKDHRRGDLLIVITAMPIIQFYCVLNSAWLIYVSLTSWLWLVAIFTGSVAGLQEATRSSDVCCGSMRIKFCAE